MQSTFQQTHPLVHYINLILEKAIQAHASDIHFEPFENTFRIRYRADGILHELPPPPLELLSSLAARIKVMAKLNITETRLPQDGHIQYPILDKNVDLRVSTLPTAFGESVVIRILDQSIVNLELESLGIPKSIYTQICDTIKKPYGIFIVTGPTGSGKTTTLYSCLRKINSPSSKILTVEDPVEYEIQGLMQVPVNDAIDLTFSKTLRAFLRQDPDCIMIGEIRDLETAQIAIQASLTGHLVFTTLHTNDTTSTIIRLLDMGIEPFLLAASLECILAQRLLRRICTHCRIPLNLADQALQALSIDLPEKGSFYWGEGCECCNGTGYRGRIAVFEFLAITDPIRELINTQTSALAIRQKAIELGMISLREHALTAVYAGDTTIEETLKYIT